MKKLIGLLTILISFQGMSQTKEELLKSKDFQQYVNSLYQMSYSIGSKFTSEQRSSLVSDLESKKNNNLTDAQQFEYIASSFRFRDVNTFKGFYDSLVIVRQKLDAAFNDIPQQAFTDAAAVIIEDRAPSCENRWRFIMCSATVTAEGTVMLAACETGTVGIGTPICIAAAVAYTAGGIADCHDKWCRKTTVAL